MSWRDRIAIDPAVHSGEPCIKESRVKGSRMPVSVIVGSIADDDTPAQISDAWPQLTEEDVNAALKFAAKG